jgi:hypothetical protein
VLPGGDDRFDAELDLERLEVFVFDLLDDRLRAELAPLLLRVEAVFVFEVLDRPLLPADDFDFETPAPRRLLVLAADVFPRVLRAELAPLLLRVEDVFVFEVLDRPLLPADDFDFETPAARRLLVLAADLFRRVLRVPPGERGARCCPCSPPSDLDSSSDSSPASSFLATPTAAGIATPRAAPATTFFGVDRPSASPSSSVAITHLPRGGVVEIRQGSAPRLFERLDEPRNDRLRDEVRPVLREVRPGRIGGVLGNRDQRVASGVPPTRRRRRQERR